MRMTRWLRGAGLVLVLAGCASKGPAVPEPARAPGTSTPAAATPAPAGPTIEAAPVPAPGPASLNTNAFRACRERAKRQEILLDSASRKLHQTVCGASLWFDGLFGERDLDAALRSSGSVELAVEYSEFTGVHVRPRFHLQVKLPALEERLSAFIGRDDETDVARDRTEGHALRSHRRPTDRDEFLAGLGYKGITTDQFQSDFKVGVTGLKLPKVFVQNRFSYVPYSQEDNRVMLRITPFWNNRDGFGGTSSTSFDHTIAEAYLLRWGTVATISRATAGLDWRTAVILYQDIARGNALAYEAFIRGATRAPEPLGEYGARTIYRRPFMEDRYFLEWVLGYSWPRDDPTLPRKGAVDVSMGVEIPFGSALK
jgi:hypothetical protein